MTGKDYNAMTAYLYVGLGGALGAMMRYALSMVTVKTDFPMMTFFTNFLGAIVIGLVVGLAAEGRVRSDSLMLFLKTGFCGGFTTFSTFSLETLNLFENRNYGMGACYAGLSLICCVAGVWIGKGIADFIAG